MRRVLFTVLCAAAMPHSGFAACAARSDTTRHRLVELYTSEGCDSCPPAEKWMMSLDRNSNVISLEFHVDYWDNAQWKDPFSSPVYTARQESVSHRAKAQVFTPQVWVDGQLWTTWGRSGPPDATDASMPPLIVTIDDASAVRVRLDSDVKDEKSDYRMYAALSQNGLTQDVRGGENRGKTLDHENVVRAFSGPLSMPHADTELKIPERADPAQLSVVAFVANERDGSIVQSVKLPLSQCRK